MLNELENHGLEVIKLRTDTGYVRCPVSVNCSWYRYLCEQHQRTRKKYPKSRTFIKRRETTLALKRMINGNLKGPYAERILEVVQSIEKGYC